LKDDTGNLNPVYDGKGVLTGFVGEFSNIPDNAKFTVEFGKGEFSNVSKKLETGLIDSVSKLTWDQNHFDSNIFSNGWSPVQSIERTTWIGCFESISYCKLAIRKSDYCGFTANFGSPDCPVDPTLKYPKTTGCWGHYITTP
jgi:hypothetical protein